TTQAYLENVLRLYRHDDGHDEDPELNIWSVKFQTELIQEWQDKPKLRGNSTGSSSWINESTFDDLIE
ncbi:hypothetical protein Ocin01_20160, partial [Orchesella cincta]